MRWGAIITIGILLAAIIRASGKVADNFEDYLTEDSWLGDGPAISGGGGQVQRDRLGTVTTHVRTHDGKGFSA